MTLTEAKEELDKFVRLKTTMRPTFADVLMSDDVVEVRHGRWIEASAHDPCDYRCTECGWLSDDEYHYCPNCGAKMDTICSFLSDEEVKQPCIEGPCGFECKRMDEGEE